MWMGAVVWIAATTAAAPSLDEARRLFERGECDAGRKAARSLLAAAEKGEGKESLAVARVLDLWVEEAGRCGHVKDAKTMAMAERAVAIKETALGPDHPDVAASLVALAGLVSWDAPPPQLGLAAAALDRALTTREKAFGRDDPRLIPIVERLLLTADLTGTVTQAEYHALRDRLDHLWKKAGSDLPLWIETTARADRIEVARLSDDHSYKGPGFPLYPYSSFAPVLDTRIVSGAELKPLVDLFRALVEKPGGQARCHNAAFGLRFLHGEERLIETSLCFQCNNLSLPTVAGDYRWVSMTDDKDVSGRMRSALAALFAPAAAPTTSPKAR